MSLSSLAKPNALVSSPPVDSDSDGAIQPDFDSCPISPISSSSEAPDDASVTSAVVGFGRSKRHSMLPTLADPSQDLTQSTVVGFGRRRHFHREAFEVDFRKYEIASRRMSFPLPSLCTGTHANGKRQSLPVLPSETRRTRPFLDISTLQSAIAWEESRSAGSLPPFPPTPVPLPILPPPAAVANQPRLRIPRIHIKRRLMSAATSHPVQLLLKRFSSQSAVKPVKSSPGSVKIDLGLFGWIHALMRLVTMLLVAVWRGVGWRPPMWF